MYGIAGDTTYTGNKFCYPIHSRGNAVDIFQNLVEKELLSLEERINTAPAQPFHNLSMSDRQALVDLKSRKDIVIREADKSGAVVLLNDSDYKAEALRQLNDPLTNCMLRSYPTQIFKNK